jgi:DNA-binding PadR family transcriptional regulator
MPLTDFEQLVLLAVARLGPGAYGMVVRDEIRARTGRSASLAAVYSVLGKLERRGLVASWVSEPTSRRGGRATKHFTLGREGALALRAAQSVMHRMWDGVELSSYLEGR